MHKAVMQVAHKLVKYLEKAMKALTLTLGYVRICAKIFDSVLGQRQAASIPTWGLKQ
jgi:hypothetical protein